jgi:hypothetical protein
MEPRAKSLASFLLATNPRLMNTRLNQGLARPPFRVGSQTMDGALKPDTTAMGMASNCLDAGCPVDLVNDLLTHLKASQDPSPAVVDAIKDLEAQLGSETPDKNKLTDIVDYVSRTFERTTAMDMASNCLDEDCAIDLVGDLVAHLKAVKDPSPEVLKVMQDLESQLASDKPDNNVLEKLVQDALRTFTSLKGNIGLRK